VCVCEQKAGDETKFTGDMGSSLQIARLLTIYVHYYCYCYYNGLYCVNIESLLVVSFASENSPVARASDYAQREVLLLPVHTHRSKRKKVDSLACFCTILLYKTENDPSWITEAQVPVPTKGSATRLQSPIPIPTPTRTNTDPLIQVRRNLIYLVHM